MKKIGLLLAAALILSGCAGAGDWRVELVKPLEIWRSSAHDISLVRRTSENGAEIWVGSEIRAVQYNDDFICLQRKMDSPDGEARGELYYYIVVTATGKRYGPLTLSEYEQTCAALSVPDLGAWVEVKNLPGKKY